MNHSSQLALAACCAVATAAVAVAHPHAAAPTPEQRAERSVEVRQAVMTVQAFSLGPAAAMLRKAPFDAATVQQAAARLKVVSGMIAEAFKNDTSKFQVKTSAKPEIWSNQGDFDMAVNTEVQAVDALQTAAMGGDKDATLKALQDVTKSCGGCHDHFREKEKG